MFTYRFLRRRPEFVPPALFNKAKVAGTSQQWGGAVADGDGRTRACGEMQGLSCVRKNQKSMSEQQIASPEQGRLHSLIMWNLWSSPQLIKIHHSGLAENPTPQKAVAFTTGTGRTIELSGSILPCILSPFKFEFNSEDVYKNEFVLQFYFQSSSSQRPHYHGRRLSVVNMTVMTKH